MLHLIQLFNRIRLPALSVLPVAGAVIGLYAGLAAGIFANLVGFVSGISLAPARVVEAFKPGSLTTRALSAEFGEADWHLEYILVGLPLAAGALVIARLIEPGGDRDEVKRRLRVLALLVLGALALYYPLVGLSVLNAVFGASHHIVTLLASMPWWAMVLAPALGGAVVGRLLRGHADVHGHGIPEVVAAVTRRSDIPSDRGVRKLLASAITIGSGGSGGREGPIVFAGASFASAVAKTLGFSNKEMSILLASGAGAGIAASFNAPIAGAVFAMEIILREFELRVLSPIILASVTATLVGRGVLGSAQVLRRVPYQMVSGLEIVSYAILGIVLGFLVYLFIRTLHQSEDFFSGRMPGRASAWLGRQPLTLRAAIGGLLTGVLVLINPSVWGSGHEFLNLAIAGQLGLWFLASAAALKIAGTALTIGSGGSGGTFFPVALLGAMSGGFFGELTHRLFPLATAPSGAYALVGIGGAVAALNRGPLTGLMMLYELSANAAIILPLMVTCTLASAICHALLERKKPKRLTDEEVLGATSVRTAGTAVSAVAADLRFDPLTDQLLATEDGVLPVLAPNGRLYGIVDVARVRDVWREPAVKPLLVADDLSIPVHPLTTNADLQAALVRMDAEDLDALPVIDARSQMPWGIITRSAIRRVLQSSRARKHERGEHAVAPSELTGQH